jgi:hypothetical protein
MTTKNPAPAPAPAPKKSTHLKVAAEAGKTPDRQCAELAVQGLAGNAITLVNFSSGAIGELSLTDCMTVLREKGDAVNRGDMRDYEAMLSAQAVALNAIFGEFARRAASNMGKHIGMTEAYARLAMKAQSQCRSTIETLAEMKNPPVVFARQANISNGLQQVNNGGLAAADAESSAQTRTGKRQMTQTELLVDESNGRTQLDTRATSKTVRGDKTMEAVAASNRSPH